MYKVSRNELVKIFKRFNLQSPETWNEKRLLRRAKELHKWVTDEQTMDDEHLDNVLDELIYAGEHEHKIVIVASDDEPEEPVEDVEEEEVEEEVDEEEEEDEDDEEEPEEEDEEEDEEEPEEEEDEPEEEEVDEDELPGEESNPPAPSHEPRKKGKKKVAKRAPTRAYSQRKQGSMTRVKASVEVLMEEGLDSSPTLEMIERADKKYVKGGGKSNMTSARTYLGISFAAIKEWKKETEGTK